MLWAMGATIGIISGSGPEAGLDLHAKLLRAQRELLGDRYRGDLDAPRVVTIAEPRLGLSMELPAHDAEVWTVLERVATQLAPQVDVYAIACNTLNVYADRLRRLVLDAELVTVADVSSAFARDRGLRRLGLLGAAPVTDLKAWSAYATLADELDLVTPADPEALHQLIHDVKLAGGSTPELARRLRVIVDELDVDPVLLACTELPLVDCEHAGAETVDVTELLARALVRRAI